MKFSPGHIHFLAQVETLSFPVRIGNNATLPPPLLHVKRGPSSCKRVLTFHCAAAALGAVAAVVVSNTGGSVVPSSLHWAV
jgi:hypothetical protein